MPQINQLPTRTPVAGDLIAFFSSANGDASKASFTALATLISSIQGVSGGGGFITQYSQPVTTGFSAVVGGSGQSVWLIITPTSSGLAGTITLPDVATVADQQELIVVTTSNISLTYSATGMTVYGAPANLPAGGYLRLKYDAVSKFWYCISATPTTDVRTVLTSVAGVLTIDCSFGDYFSTALHENITSIVFTNTKGVGYGMTKFVEIIQDDAIAYTVDFPASPEFLWVGGSVGVVSATLGAIDELAITSIDNAVSWKATLSNEWS